MAGVLRREDLTSIPAFSFNDVEAEAQRILREANEKARKILADTKAQAQRNAKRIEQKAHTAGLEEGRQQGRAEAIEQGREAAANEARQSLNQLGQSIGTAIAGFDEAKRRLLAQAETGIIKLALEIARRVCKHDVSTSPQVAIDNARQLLEMVKHESDIQLRLNPAEAGALRDVLPQVLASVGHCSHAEVIEDEDVLPGGVELRSRGGTIDATLEMQLERVAAALLPAAEDHDEGQ